MMNGGFKKGIDIISLGLHSYDFLTLRRSVTLISRILYSTCFSSSTSCLVTPATPVWSSPVKIPLFKAPPSQLTGSLEFGRRAFCDGADLLSNADGSGPEPNLEDCRTVLAFPLPHKPLIPGFYMRICVKDPKLLAALQESIRQETPYAAAFLLNDYASTNSSSSPLTENTVRILKGKGKKKLKGKELLNSIHKVGTLAQISRIQGEDVVLLGHRRVRITKMVSENPLTIKVYHLKDKPFDKEDDDLIKAKYVEVASMLLDVLEKNLSWKYKVQTYTFKRTGEFSYQHLADLGVGISGADKDQIQWLLEELDFHKRLELAQQLVKEQVEINKKQRLPVDSDDESPTENMFRERIDPIKDQIPKHVLKVIEEELAKLLRSNSYSSSYNETYKYLDWLTVLPWGNFSDENFDVQRAKKIIDDDHYGLSDVKERILEFIAVGRLRGTSQGKIICLCGPPGVGKTSIGRSIARALNREFFRFSVGGLADVDEIKGHCRTYVGAVPGKLVQCLKSVGTENPLILVDEIDKIGSGSRKGDPASALLEVMDPEQNANFLDHYLNVTIDLSKVLFVCTANVIDTIPGPLLDRMEVIDLTGYLTDEKMHIARDYLLKKTCRDCGIKPEQVVVTDTALLLLIENYCREAGIRNLQKHIEKIYRKIALKLVYEGASPGAPASSEFRRMKLDDIMKILKSATVDSTESEATVDSTESKAIGDSTKSKPKQRKVVAKTVEKFTIDESNLVDYVGKPVFRAEKIYEETPVGVVMGLAWTSMGGSILYIETSVVVGEGKSGLHITGRLGDVMKESAEIAHTVARRIMLEKEPGNQFFSDSRLHLHFPEGATPKDGPSAGCTIITSFLSLAMKKPVRNDLAMTGELTLTGRILPIGGVREKTLAARRSKVKTIIFSEANRRDFDELAEKMKEGLEVHFVDDYEQIFKLAFGYEYHPLQPV